MTDSLMVHIEYIRQKLDEVNATVQQMSNTYVTRREFDSDIKNLHKRIDRIHSNRRSNLGLIISGVAVVIALGGFIVSLT